MTPEEILALLQTIARQQVQIARLEQMLAAQQQANQPPPESEKQPPSKSS